MKNNKKVFCFVPNGIIIFGKLWISKYQGLIKIESAAILWRNKSGNADFWECIKKGTPWMDSIEPLNKHVYINGMHLNMHYMDEDAEIAEVGETHDDIIVGADHRFLFKVWNIWFENLEDWYIVFNNWIKKIDSYTGSKGLGLGKYECSDCGEEALININNILFISGLE